MSELGELIARVAGVVPQARDLNVCGADNGCRSVVVSYLLGGHEGTWRIDLMLTTPGLRPKALLGLELDEADRHPGCGPVPQMPEDVQALQDLSAALRELATRCFGRDVLPEVTRGPWGWARVAGPPPA